MYTYEVFAATRCPFYYSPSIEAIFYLSEMKTFSSHSRTIRALRDAATSHFIVAAARPAMRMSAAADHARWPSEKRLKMAERAEITGFEVVLSASASSKNVATLRIAGEELRIEAPYSG